MGNSEALEFLMSYKNIYIAKPITIAGTNRKALTQPSFISYTLSRFLARLEGGTKNSYNLLMI